MNVKNLDATSKNYTKEELQNKKLAEDSVWVGNEYLESPPEWLRDDISAKEWERLVGEFRKINMISNLDYNNLGNYCNTHSKLVELEEKITRIGLFAGRNVSPYEQLRLKLADDMRKWAATLGLTVQTRLVGSKGVLDKKQGELGDEFGEI